MNKKFLTFGILVIVLAGVLVPVANVFAETKAQTDCRTNGGVWTPNIVTGGGSCGTNDPSKRQAVDQVNKTAEAEDSGLAGWIWKAFAQGIGAILMGISSLVLMLCGMIFDWIVDFSIVKMATNIGDPAGVGGAITLAWATLRDIANMCFIFVLLYAAFKTMFDSNFSNFGKTVRDIIIVALLINFSLFFSKIVIDASNIVAVGFYNSITSASTLTATGTASGSAEFKGISAGYMNMLKLQTFFSSDFLTKSDLSGGAILTMGVMGAIFMLITAVILLIAGIMFAARFIILIFLMILSPLALIAYIIPGQMGKFNEWKDALIAQSFFAPIFFALTWVVFKLGTSLLDVLNKTQNGQTSDWTNVTTNPNSALALIINYVLIMGFAIAALVISKQMASKTAGFSAISGGMISGASLLGRNTIGRGANLALNSEKLRNMASDKNRSWASRTFAKSTLWTSKKGAEGSFDVRGVGNTGVGKALGAGDMFKGVGSAGGKGGFDKAVKDKAERKAKYAKDVYGQTETEKEKKEFAEDATAKHEAAVEGEKRVVTDEEKEAKEEKEKAEKELETKKKEAEQADKDRIAGKAGVTTEMVFEAHKKAKQAEEELSKKIEAHDLAIAKKKAVIEDKNYSETVQLLKKEADARNEIWNKVKNNSAERQRAYAERLGGGLTGWMAGNKASARAVRTQARGKSKAEKLADAASEYQKSLDEAAGKTSTTPVAPVAPSVAPAGGSPPPPAPTGP
jgi:hypothetical protein